MQQHHSGTREATEEIRWMRHDNLVSHDALERGPLAQTTRMRWLTDFCGSHLKFSVW